jgi:hypothetical protein
LGAICCRERFIEYWVDQNMLTADTATRIFTVLKQPDKNYLTQEDFRPILRELLATHRGLEFLHDTPEFQERYAETVIYRIFFYVNKAGNGQLQLREIKRSNLIASLQQVDEEEDINKVLRMTYCDMETMLSHTALLSVFFHRYQGNSAVKLKERWVMKTLSGLYFLRRTSHQSPALSIGSFLTFSPSFLSRRCGLVKRGVIFSCGE